MNATIEKIYQALELDQKVWLTLEKSEPYATTREQLENLYKEIRCFIQEHQGNIDVQDHEDYVNKLIDLSSRYFFEKGILMGIQLGLDVNKTYIDEND